MDFDLSEEQNLTRQAIRAFAEKQIAPIAQKLDAREEFSIELTRKMADLGLLGCFVPEKYGGSNMGYISYAIAVEELQQQGKLPLWRVLAEQVRRMICNQLAQR